MHILYVTNRVQTVYQLRIYMHILNPITAVTGTFFHFTIIIIKIFLVFFYSLSVF